MDESRWNDFSRRFADLLFAEFPDWRSIGSLTQSVYDEGAWHLEIASPAPGDKPHPLYVSTDDESITTGFDFHHTHFCSFAGEDEEAGFLAAVDYLRCVVTEQEVAVSRWSGSAWTQCVIVPVGEVSAATRPRKGEKWRVRSWLGSYDRDLPP